MSGQVITLLGNAVANASLWFDKVFEASQGKTFYIATISIVFVMRFLLRPILGSGSGSDKAKEKKGDEK